jgi:hypothetical protein
VKWEALDSLSGFSTAVTPHTYVHTCEDLAVFVSNLLEVHVQRHCLVISGIDVVSVIAAARVSVLQS